MDELDFSPLNQGELDFAPLFEKPKAEIGAAIGKSPEEAGKVLGVAKETGLPAPYVGLDPDTTLNSWRANEAAKFVESNPGYAKFLQENPFAAQTSMDDLAALRRFAGVIGPANLPKQVDAPIPALLKGTVAGFGAARQGIAEAPTALRAVAGSGERGTPPETEVAREGLSYYTNLVGQALGLIGASAPGAVKGAAIGGTIGAAFAGVGAGPGAALGATAGFLYEGFLAATGTSFQELSNSEDTLGKKMDPQLAAAGSLVSGIVQTAFNAVQVEKVVPIGSLVNKILGEALTRPAVRTTLAQGLREIGEAGVVGGLAEAASTVLDELTKFGTKSLSGLDYETILNSDVERERLVQNVVDGLVVGAVTLGGVKAVPVGFNILGDKIHEAQVRRNQTQLDELMTIADESKTHERSADLFSEYAHNLLGDQVISLPVEVVQGQLDAFGYVADLQKQVEDLGEAGGDVQIPLWQFVSHTPLELYQTLRDQVKGENGVSAQDLAELAQAEVTANLPRVDPIYNEVYNQLLAAKVPVRQAAANATLWTARYHTRAARLGLESTEAYKLFREQGVEIKLGEKLSKEELTQLAGVKARTADILKLNRAKEMSAQGESVEKIWALTGWSVGADGKWRFEIPDGDSRTYNASFLDLLKNRGSVLLDQLYNNPRLYAAYPALRGITVNPELYGEYYGLYMPTKKAIWLDVTRPLELVDSTLVHEIQHAIQDIEGFDSGASPDYVRSRLLTKAVQKVKAASEAEIDDALENYNNLINKPDDYFYELYRRVTGEVEAKNVQDRLEMRSEELRKLPPEATERVRRDQQIRPKQIGELYQSSEEAIRGSILLDEGKNVISLFQKRDASTFMHESAHLWLTELEVDAGLSSAIAADLALVRSWLGLAEGEAFNRAAQEKWARGFEAYLREGKAPIKGLEKVFEQFKQWLTKIYETILDVGGEVPKEIKAVMDRMLATSESEKIIKAALRRQRRALWLDPVVEPKALGMSKEQFALYSKHLEKAQEALDAKARKGAETAVKQTESDVWKEALKIELEAATLEVRQAPIFQADNALRTGATSDGVVFSFKIDPRDLVELDIDPKDMPKGSVSSTKGVPLDVLADRFGFKSGAQLARQLRGLELARKATGLTPEEYMSAEIKDLVAERMENRFGNLEAKTLEDAIETLAAKPQLQLLADELSALGGNPLDVERVTRFVEDKFSGMNVATATRWKAFERAVATFGRRAEVALLKGKAPEAFFAKQRQFVNLLMLKNSREFERDLRKLEKITDRFKRPTVTNMPQEFTDQIHSVMLQLGFKVNRDAQELGRGLTSREDFVSRYENYGYEFNLPDFLASGIPVDFKSLTVSQARDLTDFLTGLAHVGKELQSVEVAGKKLELEEAAVETITKINELPGKLAGDNTVSKFLRSVDASLSRIEFLFSRLEGMKGGPLTDIFREMSKAKTAEIDRVKKFGKSIERIVDKRWGASLKNKVDNDVLLGEDGRPMVLNRGNLIAIALNLGNEGNKQRLFASRAWTEANVMSLLDRELTKNDWNKVQEIWDLVGGFWPEAEALSREMSGVGLRKVEATPVDTGFGKYKGGYYPILYENSVREPNAFGEGRFKLYTGRGYTRSRAGKINQPAPVELSFETLPGAMMEVIHDLSFRKPLAEARKLLDRRDLRKAIDQKYGGEYVKAIDSWLNNIAEDSGFDHKAVSWAERFAGQARINMTIATMAFRVAPLMDFSPVFTAAEAVGPVNYGRAIATILRPKNFKRMIEFAQTESGEVRNRMDLIDNNIRDGLRQLVGKNDLLSQARRMGFYGFALLDMLTGMPLWHAAYDKAIKAGESHANAVAKADSLLRRAQGSGHNVDTAQVLRSNEFMKNLTLFYSWFNTAYNNIRDIGYYTKTSVGELKKGNYEAASHDAAMALSKTFWWIIMMAISDYLIRGAPGNEDDDPGKRFAATMSNQITGTVPLVRDAVKMLWGEKSNPDTPIMRIGKEAVAGLNDLYEGTFGEGDVSDKWVRHAIQTPGYVFGIPGSGQAAVTGQFLWDLHNGDQVATSMTEFLRGTTWGKAEKAP